MQRVLLLLLLLLFFFSVCVFSSTFTTPVATCRLLLLHYSYILYSYRHRCLRDTSLSIRLVVTKDIITHPISTIKTRLQVQVATGIWSHILVETKYHDDSWCIMHHATSVIEPCCILRIHGPVMILLYEGPFQDMQSKCTFFLQRCFQAIMNTVSCDPLWYHDNIIPPYDTEIACNSM